VNEGDRIEDVRVGDILQFAYGMFGGDWEHVVLTRHDPAKPEIYSGFLRRSFVPGAGWKAPFIVDRSAECLDRPKENGFSQRESLNRAAENLGVRIPKDQKPPRYVAS
jgi:hypothetical protein